MTNLGPNLLPPERLRVLVSSYYARLFVAGFGLLVVVLLAAAALLSPSYIYLSETLATKEALLSQSGGKDEAEESLLAARTAALRESARVLTNVVQGRSTSALLRDVLAVPRPGVMLVGFNHTPANGNKPGTLILSGTALSRDQLHSYQRALMGMPFAASVDLPVNAYAKETNISFSMTISLKP